jgi:hypothetical protein
MDIAARYVIVPRKHLYWVEAVDPDGSRRAIEVFRDEGAAVERLRSLQSQQEKMELRLHALRASRFHVVGYLGGMEPDEPLLDTSTIGSSSVRIAGGHQPQ